jgi:hypothetical protein
VQTCVVAVLRRACDPVQTEEGWRIKHNEFEKLLRGEDIVKYIRTQRIK